MNTRQLNSSSRRGISLMEVLISMFVLAVGLLGVAALIPAGRHEIVEATKLETSAMVGRNAFRELQTRGYLNPALNPLGLNPTSAIGWRDTSGYNITGTFGYRPDVSRTDGTPVPFAYQDPTTTSQTNYDDPTYFSNQLRIVIDPLGLTALAGPYLNSFPNGFAGPSPPPLRRIVPFQPASNAFACFDTIFRSSVDLTTAQNKTNKDLPPNQDFYRDPPITGTTLLRRMSVGNYSWMATIVSDPSRPANSGDVNVSVAVFYKRDMSAAGAGEYSATVSSFPLDPTANPAVNMTRMPSGGEIVLANLPSDATGKLKAVRPGQWVMLAGYRMTSGATPVPLNYYRWYRVLSAGNPVGTNQNVTLAGQDWSIVAGQTNVWIFDNIVSVYEKSMPLELE